MATFSGLCEPGGLLFGRRPSGFNTGICFAPERGGPLEWIGCRSNCAITITFSNNRSYRLGKTGILLP